GRELLGARLTRRGITLSAALFAPFLSECAASAAVPSALAAATADAALAHAAGKAVPALATAPALALAQGIVPHPMYDKVKCEFAFLFAAVLAGFSGSALSKDARSLPPTPPPAERQQGAKAAPMDLPAGADTDAPKAIEPIEFRIPLLAAHAAVQRELNLTA